MSWIFNIITKWKKSPLFKQKKGQIFFHGVFHQHKYESSANRMKCVVVSLVLVHSVKSAAFVYNNACACASVCVCNVCKRSYTTIWERQARPIVNIPVNQPVMTNSFVSFIQIFIWIAMRCHFNIISISFMPCSIFALHTFAVNLVGYATDY